MSTTQSNPKQERLQEAYQQYKITPELRHLRAQGKRFVGGAGPLDARLVLVGEAPGEHEDDAGRPFVGPDGQILDKLLKSAGIRRDRIFITNMVKYRTTKDTGNNRHPNSEEIDASRLTLQREIDIIQPTVVGLMGRTAMKFLSPFHWPHEQHGKVYRYSPTSRPVVLLYHPGVIVYEKSMMETLTKDFKVVYQTLVQEEQG